MAAPSTPNTAPTTPSASARTVAVRARCRAAVVVVALPKTEVHVREVRAFPAAAVGMSAAMVNVAVAVAFIVFVIVIIVIAVVVIAIIAIFTAIFIVIIAIIIVTITITIIILVLIVVITIIVIFAIFLVLALALNALNASLRVAQRGVRGIQLRDGAAQRVLVSAVVPRNDDGLLFGDGAASTAVRWGAGVRGTMVHGAHEVGVGGLRGAGRRAQGAHQVEELGAADGVFVRRRAVLEGVARVAGGCGNVQAAVADGERGVRTGEVEGAHGGGGRVGGGGCGKAGRFGWRSAGGRQVLENCSSLQRMHAGSWAVLADFQAFLTEAKSDDRGLHADVLSALHTHTAGRSAGDGADESRATSVSRASSDWTTRKHCEVAIGGTSHFRESFSRLTLR